MAETTTITRPAPVLEASLTNFLKNRSFSRSKN